MPFFPGVPSGEDRDCLRPSNSGHQGVANAQERRPSSYGERPSEGHPLFLRDLAATGIRIFVCPAAVLFGAEQGCFSQERARSLSRAPLGLPQYWAFAHQCGREAGGGQIFGASRLKSSSGSCDARHPPLHNFERPKSEGQLRRRLLRKDLRDRERGDRLLGSCPRPLAPVWRCPA